MTKTPPTNLDPQKYCAELLRINPLYDPVGVLAFRREKLGIKPAVPPETWQWSMPSTEERRKVEQQLDRIRQEFWTLALDQLKAVLEKLDVRRLPEFQPAVSRLRIVAGCRSEFPKLAAEQGMNRDLFAAFKTAVVLPPAEAGPIKQRFLRSLHDADRHRSAVSTAKMIKSKHPLIYDLERDWLDAIITRKRPQANAPESIVETPDFDFSGMMPGLGVMLLILLRLLLLLAR